MAKILVAKVEGRTPSWPSDLRKSSCWARSVWDQWLYDKNHPPADSRLQLALPAIWTEEPCQRYPRGYLPLFRDLCEVDPHALHLDVVVESPDSLLGVFQVVIEDDLHDEVNPLDARDHCICLVEEELQPADDGCHTLWYMVGRRMEGTVDTMIFRSLGQCSARDVLIYKCEVGHHGRREKSGKPFSFFSEKLFFLALWSLEKDECCENSSFGSRCTLL